MIPPTVNRKKIVIHAGVLIDSIAPTAIRDQLIFIENGIIVEVSSINGALLESIKRENHFYDFSKYTVMSGLIDAHIHFFGVPSTKLDDLMTAPEAFRSLRAAREAKEMLYAGITAARCCGSSISPSLKRAIDLGLIEGPRLVVAGQFVCASNGTWDHIKVPVQAMREAGMLADGPDQLRQKVRERIREGAGLIKIGLSVGAVGDEYHAWGDDPDKSVTSYSLDEIRAATDEAHKNRIKVSAHCIGNEAVINAIETNVDTIEHGYPIDDKTRSILAERKIIVTSTAAQLYCHNKSADEFFYSEGEKKLFAIHEASMRNNFEQGLKFGMKYALGSDLIGPPTHPQTLFYKEFEIVNTWGMSNMEAIIAGTRVSAEALGLDDLIGTVEKGKIADLIVLDSNPLQKIQALKNVIFVMKSGTIVRDDIAKEKESIK